MNEIVLTDQASVTQVLSAKNRRTHSIYTQRTVSPSWSKGLASHTWYLPPEKSRPTWMEKPALQPPHWGDHWVKGAPQRNNLPGWFAEVKHKNFTVNDQPGAPRFSWRGFLGLFTVLSFGLQWCCIWMSQQRTLTHWRLNLSAPHKNVDIIMYNS